MRNTSCEERTRNGASRWRMAAAALLLVLGVRGVAAQVGTTTVQGTVYRADGTPASGTALITWGGFTTAQNQAVAAGSLSANIGADGFLSVNLTPNAGALPAGSYYTVVYHLSDGTVDPEYWVVPASGTASIASVRAELQPSTVAVQSVTPAYVNGALASMSSSYLSLAGGTMAGPLTLSSDPTSQDQAATKHYADQIGAESLPLSGGTLNGPLSVPALSAKQLEGRLYADQYSTSTTSPNGLAQALNACAGVCNIVEPPNYSQAEAQPFGVPQSVYGNYAPGIKILPYVGTAYIYGPVSGQPAAAVEDLRYGVPMWFYNIGTPYPNGNTYAFAAPTTVVNETSFPTGISGWGAWGQKYDIAYYMGGMSAQTASEISGGGHSYKNNVQGLLLNVFRYTQAQNGGDIADNAFLYGTGDWAGFQATATVDGAANMTADEGPEGLRVHVTEDSKVFDATIAGNGIATAPDGSLTITTTGQSNSTQGQGRDLIDLSHAYQSTSDYIATITNGTTSAPITVTCGNCNWSSYGASSQTTLTAAINSPGSTNDFPESNVTVQVGNSSGFAKGDVACIWGYDYDCEKVESVPDGTHIELYTLRMPQDSGAWVTTGGLAGYGLDLNADDCSAANPSLACGIVPANGETIRWVIPIMTSNGSNSLTLFSGQNTLPATAGQQYTGRAYTDLGSGGTCSVTVNGGAVTQVTVSGGSGYSSNTDANGTLVNQPQLVIGGITSATAPVIYLATVNANGSLATAGIANAGSGISGTPTCTVEDSNPYTIYPMTKVWQVYNPARGEVDGTLWTEPPVGTFASGDQVEEPHWFMQRTIGMQNVNEVDIPSRSPEPSAAVEYVTEGLQGNDGAATTFTNRTDPTAYAGYPGGTPWTQGLGQWQTPYGYRLNGPYNSGLYLNTPPFGNGPANLGASAVAVNCGTPGCSGWTSPYAFLEGANAMNGSDSLSYSPTAGSWLLTAGSTRTRGRSAACSYGFGGSTTSLSIACGSSTSSFDTAGDLSLGGSLRAQDVTGASINGEVTVDGTTYKTLNAAWTAAASQAASTGQDQTVRLGPGTYPVSATLTEPTNGACVNLIGSGGTTVNADSPQVATTLTVPSPLNGDVVYLGNTTQAQGCTFEGLNVLAQDNATHGFEMQWFRGLLMEDVSVNDTSSDGIVLGEESTSSGHQSNFLLRNVTVSFSSAVFTPASRPAYGIHIEKTAIDSSLDNITVRNALTASVYNEGTGNTGYLIHGFGYPYTCTTAPCANNASSSSAANASYATSYVIYDTGGAGTEWTDTYVDSPAVAGFYVGANGVSIEGGHIQWPDLTSFPAANLAYVASSVTNNLLIGDVSCLGMASGANWITYANSSGTPPSFSSVHHLTGCGNYYQALEPAVTTGFSSGGANINDSSGAVPRVWATPLAASANDAAYSAQMYTGYQGDAYQAHFSGSNPFFNVTYQGTIRASGGLAMSTVLNTASTLTLTVANKNVIANAASGPQTITLPSCYTAMPDRMSPTGLELTIIKSDSSSNAVTLQTVSSENIDYNGASAQTLAITTPGKRTLICGPDYNWYAY